MFPPHLFRLFVPAGLLLIHVKFAQADISSGLIAHFPLLDGSGTTASESVAGKHGTLQNGTSWGASGVQLDGVNQHISTPADTGNGITNQLTIAAWINPERSHSWDGIVTKGVDQAPYTFGLWSSGGLVFAANVFGPPGGNGFYNVVSSRSVPLNSWSHVAITHDGSKTRFYINGILDSEHQRAITFGSINEPLIIGGDLPGGDEHFKGGIRDVRVYNRSLTNIEVSGLLPAEHANTFTGMWVGQASMNEVKEVRSGSWGAAPAFTQQILLHVDDSGTARLLREAILMKTRVDPPASPEAVILTDPSTVSSYDGVVKRGNQWVGQRFSCATLPLPNRKTTLSQSGEWLSASFTLSASHPLNPFRHKYHPDLGTAWEMARTTQLKLDASDSPSDHTITGTLWDSVAGLHKDTLECRGPITFTRVTSTGQLY